MWEQRQPTADGCTGKGQRPLAHCPSDGGMNTQTISLARVAMVNGLQWQLFPVDFKTEEGTFSVYLYAINREHAAAILLELKETAVLRDGDLAGIARND